MADARDKTLSEAEIARYQRHLVLKEIGGPGQQKLKNAAVLIIGMGGLGQPAAQYLAAAGIGRLGFVDDDDADVSNLQRQILLTEADCGRAKTDSALARLNELNRHVDFQPHRLRLNGDNAAALIADYDVILDGCDNFATRFIVNDACFDARKTLISGAVGRFDGQIACFKPWLKDAAGTALPCYRSLVPEMADGPETADNCATTGIIGALTGIIGSMMALEAIKEITGAGDSLAGHMLVFDGLSFNARKVKINWDPENPNNGQNTV